MLYNVVQLSTPTVSHIVNIEDYSMIVEEKKKTMEAKIAALQSQYPEITFSSEVESGFLIESINDKCNEIKPIAVLMGISGSGTGFEKFIGSNAILAMKNLHYPLIIIPNNGVFSPYKKLCLACDLKNVLASTPLISIKALTALFNTKLLVLNVDYHNRHYTAQTADELANLEYILEDVQHELHFIENENVQDAVNDFVDKNGVDMLIMIPKKHSLFEGLFHKSQTKEMAYQTHVPILALHQD